MLFIFLLDCSGFACFEFVVVVMVIACSRFTLTFVGGVKPHRMLSGKDGARVISWHSLDHICTIVSARSFVSGVWSRTEPRARTLYVYNISNLEIYHCHSFSDTAKPAVCRRPKIVSFNDLSGFCWIQRMSRERIKGRQTTEIEAKVKMRR